MVKHIFQSSERSAAMKRKPIFPWLAVLALWPYFSHGLAAAELSLAAEGESKYTIVTPAEATVQEKFAGEELAKYLKRISGAELAVQSTGAGPKIVVAQAKDGKGPAGISFTKDEAEYDAFVIKTDGQDLYLVGSNKRAVLYAVYTLLEKYLGCRWAGFGERFQTEEQKKSGGFTEQVEEYVPASKSIALPVINDRQQASFKYRGFISYAWYGNTPINNVDWAAKNKLNYFWIPIGQYDEAGDWRKDVVMGGMVKRGAVIVVGHHSFIYFLNPDKYFKDHPDWFAMAGGKRVPGGRTGGQFCLSNPDAVKTFRENFIAAAKKFPEVDIFAPCPNDGYGWCECELCAKDKVAWEERPKYQAVGDNLMRLMNRLNDDLQTLYPGQGKRLQAGAYINYAPPPSREKLSRGLLIGYAFFTRNWFSVPWGNAKGEVPDGPYAFKLNAKFLEKWVELTQDTGGDAMVLEYYCGRTAWKGAGFYLMNLITDELGYFRRIGVHGAAVQIGFNCRKTVPANMYVFAKNLWDVSLPTDAILADYAKARFGKAADPMMKYLREAERNSRELSKVVARGKEAERAKSLADCEKYLDDAKALADTDQARKNLADEQANFKKLKAWQLGK